MTLKLRYDDFKQVEEQHTAFDEEDGDRLVILGTAEYADHIVAAVNSYEAFHGTIEKRRAEKKAGEGSCQSQQP